MSHYLFVFMVFSQLHCMLTIDSPSYWNNKAKDELERAKKLQIIDKRSKNVIFVVGDGMGISTQTTTRVLKGELTNTDGERNRLSFETLEHVGLVMTYNTDRLVADSAGTATAFLSGVKTKSGLIGVDANVNKGDCSTFSMNYAHKSFAEYAKEGGKSVGIVTTTRITHATPAAAYAFSADRDWESDRDMAAVPLNLRPKCPDIATQLISNGLDFKVILGGGRMNFMLHNESDPSNSTFYGVRRDQNLINLWKSEQVKRERRHQYVTTGSDLRALNPSAVDYLLGLFSYSHMDYDLERSTNNVNQPELWEMVDKAVSILQRNEKGYVLIIEAGRIDHAHHGTLGKLALYDTLALDRTIENLIRKVDFQETLMVVTADHSHVFTFGSYHRKGDPLFGTMNYLAVDNKTFTSLLYANGPSAPVSDSRENVTQDTSSSSYRQQAAIPLMSETHGGEDVAVHASGPMAHLFHGVHEQNYLAHVVMYSACLGQYKNEQGCPISKSSALAPMVSVTLTLVSFSLIINSSL